MSELFFSSREQQWSRAWWAWMLEEIAFALLLTVVAVLPWVFSATQLDALELPKQTYLVASGGLVWLVLLGRDILRGKWEFPWDRSSKIVIGLLVVLGLLACLSRDRYGAWIGVNKQIPTSVLTMLAGGVWWLAIRRLVQAPVRLMLVLAVFLTSAGLFALGTCAWLFDVTVWPWSLSTFRAITPLGTVSDTALFLVPATILAAASLVQGTAVMGHRFKRASLVVRLLAALVLVSSLLLIGAISSPVLWAGLLVGMLVFVLTATHPKERRIWIAGAVFALLCVGVSAFSPSWDPWRKLGDRISLTIPAEIALSTPTSWSIAWQGFKADPLVGRGAGTWVNLFLQERDPALNRSPYAAVRFFQGASSAVTAAGTMGVVGLLALLAWLLLPLATVQKRKISSELQGFTPLVLAPWAALVVLWGGLSFTTASVFLFWWLSALLIATRASSTALVSFSLYGRKRHLAPAIVIALVSLTMLWGSMQRLLAEQMFVAGKAALEAGEVQTAERALALAHAWNPGNDIYIGLLSQAYGEEVRLALAAQPSTQELPRIVTVLRRAETLNAQARALNPERSESWLAAATLAATHALLEPRGQDLESDLNALKRAAELDPTNTRIALTLGNVYSQRLEDAYPLLVQTDERVRTDAKRRYDEALEGAQTWFARAQALDPEEQAASIGLAQLAVRDGKFANAIQAVEEVVRLGNTSQDLQVQLALLYLQTDQTELAIRTLEAVVGQHPSDASPLARYHLGELYAASLRYEEALALFEGLTKQFPQEASLQERYVEIQRALLQRPLPQTLTVPTVTTTSSTPAVPPSKKRR